MAVVTGLAVSAAGTAASIGMNLAAAAKQSKAQSAAEQAAAEAAKKAEAEYGKQFLGGVQIPTEAYKQALQQGTAQQMQSLQALQEADTRTLAAGVGKVQAEATQAQSSIMNQQAEDMYRLELAQAAEQSRSSENIAKMNQERAMGAQMAAADAEAAKAKLYGSIGTSIASLGGQVLQAAPLYGETTDLEGISQITPAGTVNQQTPIPTSSFNLSAFKTPIR
jgi:hypothetical protein